MNEFIKLRETIFESKEPYDFSEILLKKVLGHNEDMKIDEQVFLSRLNVIEDVYKKNQLDDTRLKELLSYLGENPYIDRYIVDAIIHFRTLLPEKHLINILGFELKENLSNRIKTYHLIDMVMELNLDFLSNDFINQLIEDNKSDFDFISLMIQYCDQFNIEISYELLFSLIKIDYPIAIKIQILELIKKDALMSDSDLSKIKNHILTDDNQVFVSDYIDYLDGKHQRNKNGTVILQSMFYGDFEDSGKGNNGGLAILLKTLGNEISLDDRVDLVITMTISDVMDKPFMVYYQDNHLFVRLPAYLNRNVVDPFLKRELFIKRYIKNTIGKFNIMPDVFHIRYLDNASMAVAKLSKELKQKLVLTLAPDPHRNMVDETGHLKKFSFEEIQILCNKIKIGDKLISMSDKVLGIGGSKVNKELLSYFPEFIHYKMEYKIKMIAEGIKTDEDMFKKLDDMNICELNTLVGTDPSFCDKPVILNVGRLAVIKGQVNLFKAWSNSSLKDTHNLLIIGGDLEKPNEEEKNIIDFFNQEIKKNPDLKKSFFHKGAMHNDQIKTVEKSIMKKSFDLPHIYLASSIKEEFGIAILEAMSRGFLIIAPIKGGVKTYITNRVNGFLIDTSSDQTIARDAEEIIYKLGINHEEFKKIQEAGIKTIKDNFSIDKIASNFTETYLDLLGGNEDEL